MIHTFNKWAVLEHFGNGSETFEEKLDIYGEMKNLDITPPIGWDIESASGKLIYTASLDVRRGGIEDIYFTIEAIEIEIENRIFKDDEDDEGELQTLKYEFNKDNMKDPKVEVHDLPFYLHTLEIDFSQAEDIDGEIDLKKVRIQMDIGHIE